MPGLITHYICGDICINKIEDDNIRRILKKHRQIYNIGTQGPDMFFYYLPCLVRKNWLELGNRLHKTNVRAYMDAMISAMYALDKEKRESVASYLAGYLTHYALDCHTHPYIYYKAGFKTEGDRTHRLKYSVNHRNFETGIDVLMLKLISSEKPSDKRLWELLHVTSGEVRDTAEVISRALKDVYDVNMSRKHVYNAMFYMFTTNRILQSRGGKRKRLMEFIESFTFKEHVVSSLIHKQLVDDGVDYLNIKKSPWHYPWDNKNPQTHSFTEMFEKSVEESLSLITAEFAFLNGELSKDELMDMIGNRSLASGQDADSDFGFKYFENKVAV